jgi:DNA polymerase IV
MAGIRKIIHVDMDAFYASVEQRDQPRYRGKPLVVGGTPEQRGAIAAASYEARKYGIHSAMPSRIAIKKCPHLIFVRPRFDVYRAISEQIRAIFYRYTDLVEPLSLDEAYLDVTENKQRLPSATLIAQAIKQHIYEETSLTASAGVSINKFLAKTASGIDKPNGLLLIPPEDAEAFVEQLPIEKFYGIGEVTAAKMHSFGIYSGADLKHWTETELVQRFGKVGQFYYKIARGQDDRIVQPNRIRKSLGAETSFESDLSDRSSILKALEEIAQVLKRRLDAHQTSGRTLTLKVKYADYRQVTRSKTIGESICELKVINSLAQELLLTTEIEQRQVRLLGLTLSNLEEENTQKEYIQLTLKL